MSLRKLIETFKTCLDADESLKKFELEDVDGEGYSPTVYICDDYAVVVENSDTESYIKIIRPIFIPKSSGKIKFSGPNRWTKLAAKLDLYFLDDSNITAAHKVEEKWPQHVALLKWVRENHKLHKQSVSE